MIDTYLRDNTDGIRRFDLRAKAEALGWSVELCEIEGRPFILFRAKSWKGRQPRFALVSTDDQFLPTLRHLSKIGVEKIRGEVKLDSEESIHLGPGASSIPEHHAEKRRLWAELAA